MINRGQAVPHPEWTNEMHYDALDRVIRARQLGDDGNWAETRTDYLGAAMLVTEPGGRKRRSETDALGRTTTVVEAPGENGFGFSTSYAYDALDKILSVQQGAQTRTFTYDSLGRMLSARNPERGSVAEGFVYDNNGNVVSQSDARGETVTMVYDNLNRVTARNYLAVPAQSNIVSNTAEVFVYDGCTNGIGKLCSATNGSGSRSYTYDSMGRVNTSRQSIAGAPGSPYDFGYNYTLTGQLAQMTYPSGRIVQHSYDSSDRLTGVVSGGINVSVTKFHPQGTPEEMLFGNGVREKWTLNKRLQVAEIETTRSSSPLLKLTYGYGASGLENNGNVRTQAIAAPGATLTQVYNYDPLNRLTQVTESTNVAGASNWTAGFQYDRYGNMAASGWTVPVPGAMATDLSQYNPTTNRKDRSPGGVALSPNPFDAMGNLVNDANLGVMKYDQAGRLRETQVSGKTVTYEYDAEGRRVKRNSVGIGATYYVYDGAGQLAAEYGVSEPLLCTTCYLTGDALGSTRLMTDGAGAVKQRMDYFPFGEVLLANQAHGGRQVVTDGQALTTYTLSGGPTQKFTGKERDAETGLDYFGARYMSGGLGRFTSADPKMFPDAVYDPQSWNKYGYVRNNPLRLVDPNGEDWKDVVAGISNAGKSNFVGGIGRLSGNTDFRLGQKLGDSLSMMMGAAEMLVGGGATASGAAACATGGGCFAGAPAIASGVALAGHGAVMGGTALANFMSASEDGPSSSGSSEGSPPAKSKPEVIADQIAEGGLKVQQNPKTGTQEGNITITNPSQPGTRLNVRVETHPLKPGGPPVRHANVELVKPGPKNRPQVVENKHIEQ